MDRTERFYRIDQLFQKWRAVPMKMLVEELGVSRATVIRDIEYLRDRLNAPIVWDRVRRGYRYHKQQPGDPSCALPGLWFNASEAHALLTMEHLLSTLQPGLLGPHIEPLRTRIRMLLESGDHSAGEIAKRIRILHMASRPIESAHFETIASALLGRRRLAILHYNRSKDKTAPREVSPQRLVHYRDNWYLDAWCHLRKGLRSFSVDVIEEAVMLNKKARNISEKAMNAELGAGYGIFAGRETQKAVLRFTPHIARWVSRETWHPRQQSRFDDKGCYLLTVPYANDTELLMDILRYGPEVEVLAPANLRRKVRTRLQKTLARYQR